MFAVTPRNEHSASIGRSLALGIAARPWTRNAAPRRLAAPNPIRHAESENGVNAPSLNTIFPTIGNDAKQSWTAASATWPAALPFAVRGTPSAAAIPARYRNGYALRHDGEGRSGGSAPTLA